MTRDEIIAILRKGYDEWCESPSPVKGLSPPIRTLWELQADALLAAQLEWLTAHDAPLFLDSGYLVEVLKARGVLFLAGRMLNEEVWSIVLPGPAMEDEQ